MKKESFVKTGSIFTGLLGDYLSTTLYDNTCLEFTKQSDRDAYFFWLGRRNLQDSEKNRRIFFGIGNRVVMLN